ncbi:MAG: hypothetical protein JXA74_10560 [Anaerolineae bacterium]|nr:hypothetical protein [Anaerolineae bacterium]
MAIRRMRTQSEQFWRQEYEVSAEDLNLATGMILESGVPRGLGELAAQIIRERFRKERELAVQIANRGRIYRPMDRFGIGDEVIFSALDFRLGTVAEVRPGQNPRYGPFDVIRVSFESGEEREFAVGFDHEHPLNRPTETLVLDPVVDLDEESLIQLFEPYVRAKLEQALTEHSDFMPFGKLWFLKELLPEVHVGHLNLAEAMIDQAGQPVAATQILAELGLDLGGSSEAQLFAFNRALGEDGRFDEVSLGGKSLWYLRALEPEAVFQRPTVLRPAFKAVGGEQIGITLLDLVEKVGDELDDVSGISARPSTEISYEVTFPHLYAGTLPATDQFLRLVRSLPGDHFPISMVDASSDRRFQIWVLPAEKYMCGFAEWFEAVGMQVGGQITLAAATEPMTFTLTTVSSRSRRSDWLRSVSVAEGALVVQMQRAMVDIRCDRNLFMAVPDMPAVAAHMARVEAAGTPLPALIRRGFQELAKLSSRGLVHIKSLYSLINMMRRSGMVPIAEYLTHNACFDPVGDGFWAYDVALEGQTYETAEQMRERPLSTRADLVRDQVIQYVGR